MSEQSTIRLHGVGKMYRVFASRFDNLIDAVGLGRLLPWLGFRYREFWALRGIDLELPEGARVGVVGRNGAGKSTLLKLLTGNLAVSEGTLEVHGPVHALLDTGAGFHPEFTGIENIHAALSYQGLSDSEMVDAVEEIAEFTELGQFLGQPYRTYSSGMQARLAFATATAVVRPRILIIDEVLGAGDAYFLSKCNERMRALVSAGATVLLVSHSLDQITAMCDQAIWIDRGRIAQRGPALEVVKAYQQFIRTLDDRRLRAKNRKVHNPSYHPLQYDSFSDTILVQLRVEGAPCDVAAVDLVRSGDVEDSLLVGHAQDADSTQSSFILLDSSAWSDPQREDAILYRSIVSTDAQRGGLGTAAFNVYSVHEDETYAVDVTYRAPAGATLVAEIYRNGTLHARFDLPCPTAGWTRRRLEPGRLTLGPLLLRRADREEPLQLARLEEEETPSAVPRRKSRWPGEGGLVIDEVRLRGADGAEQAMFVSGTPMRLTVSFTATAAGRYDVIPVAVLYRLDGILVTRYIGSKAELAMAAGETGEALLDIASVRLGNGYYVFTVGLYRILDVGNAQDARFYDLLDRSYEFGVEGVPPLLDGIVLEPADWTLAAKRVLAAAGEAP